MATGRAYLDFAREQSGYYVAMFESGVAIAGNPDLARAADRAMAVLMRAAERLAAHLPPERRPPATMVANHIWALSHGVVELFGRGRPGRAGALLRRRDAGERHGHLPARAGPGSV